MVRPIIGANLTLGRSNRQPALRKTGVSAQNPPSIFQCTNLVELTWCVRRGRFTRKEGHAMSTDTKKPVAPVRSEPRWCESNKNRYYIPEWLLKRWGIFVDAELNG